MGTHNHYYYNAPQQNSSNNLHPDLDFFRAHANMSGPQKLRTVTITQIMLQAAKREKIRTDSKPTKTLGASTPAQESENGASGLAQNNDYISELENMQKAYENHTKENFGITLLAACPCPGEPELFCPWDEEMVLQLIIDNFAWEIISAQIKDSERKLLATSTTSLSITSPSNNYTLLKLLKIAPIVIGGKVNLIIEWIDKNYQSHTTSLGIHIVPNGSAGDISSL